LTNWEERITRDTAPSIRLEHVLRYAAAADVARQSDLWCDLGCGSGVAAAAAFGAARPPAALLVDLDESAAADAAAELRISDTTTLALDLAERDELAKVRSAIAERASSNGCVTCFEVVEHLRAFAPVLELLVELPHEHGCTVFLSVPNDAFTAVRNPFHETAWGESSVEELRAILPDHVLLEQVAIGGSALRRPGEARQVELRAEVPPAGVPTHFVLCFGPRAGEVALPVHSWPVDLDGQRTWEREREANLAYFRARAEALERDLEDAAERERESETPASGPSTPPPA